MIAIIVVLHIMMIEHPLHQLSYAAGDAGDATMIVIIMHDA